MKVPRTKAGEKLARQLSSLNLGPDNNWIDDAIEAIEAEASEIEIEAMARALALNEFDDPADAFNNNGEPYPADIEWATEVKELYAKQLKRAKTH